METLIIGGGVVPRGLTITQMDGKTEGLKGVTKLTVIPRNFANASKSNEILEQTWNPAQNLH
jgi:hypothetical protein